MPLIPISALDDARLSPYRDLRQQNPTRQARHFIAEGDKLVDRLLTSTYQTHSIFADEQYVAELQPRVPAGVPIYVAKRSLLEATIGFNFHRGCLACGVREARGALASWTPPARANWTIVACPDVQDPTNLGTLLRNCAAFGVDLVLLGTKCADPFSRRVLRVSMGAVFELSIVESPDLFSDLKALRERHQVQSIATVLDRDAVELGKCSRPARCVLLFGSEGHGLTEAWARFADRRATIPMPPGTDSLNVAVASGIFLYHFTRVAPVES